MDDRRKGYEAMIEAALRDDVGALRSLEVAGLDWRRPMAPLVSVRRLAYPGTGRTLQDSLSCPLEAAVYAGASAAFSWLLGAGASPNGNARDGSPLAAAAWKGRKSMAATLLERGADWRVMGGEYHAARLAFWGLVEFADVEGWLSVNPHGDDPGQGWPKAVFETTARLWGGKPEEAEGDFSRLP